MVENSPMLLVVTVDKRVSVTVPKKNILTSELGSKLTPVIFIEVPTGPEVGLSTMVGTAEDVTVNVFEAELDPSVALTV